MKLKDRNVLVTGAALRIGRTLALAAAREGANVLIHYRSSHGAAMSAAEEIRALGRRSLALQADLSDPSQVNDLFEQDALPIRWLRNAGLRGVGQIAPLKQRLMRHALGIG